MQQQFNGSLVLYSPTRLDVDQLKGVYKFVDEAPSNRVKKNLNRDFSDGSYMAELLKFYLPPTHKCIVEIHNYVPTGKV